MEFPGLVKVMGNSKGFGESESGKYGISESFSESESDAELMEMDFP